MSAYDVHPRIKAGSVEAIKGLNLEGDAIFGEIGQRVFSQIFPDYDGPLFPCVIVSTDGMIEEMVPGDSHCQLWRYPQHIWICDRESQRKHEKEPLYMSWRKAIRMLFHQKNPLRAAVPEAHECTIVPEVMFDPKMPAYQHIVSGMILWVETTEER